MAPPAHWSSSGASGNFAFICTPARPRSSHRCPSRYGPAAAAALFIFRKMQMSPCLSTSNCDTSDSDIQPNHGKQGAQAPRGDIILCDCNKREGVVGRLDSLACLDLFGIVGPCAIWGAEPVFQPGKQTLNLHRVVRIQNLPDRWMGCGFLRLPLNVTTTQEAEWILNEGKNFNSTW